MLERTRKLNKVLQTTTKEAVSFHELTDILASLLDSNIYIIRADGRILSTNFTVEADSSLIIDQETGVEKFPTEYNDNLLKITDIQGNITGEDALELFKYEYVIVEKFVTIIPIYGGEERLGTVVISRYNEFTEEDFILGEYGATIVGIEILREKSLEAEENNRKKAIVSMAIGTLSYSEQEAIVHIFEELGGNEGLVIASKVADKVGITRSVIVNALRKFESAGAIESRSLGMKGTYIKVLNEYLLDQINKIEL
ncbi:MAG: GTP-sensing pleiotropic transcriptional regulator CodY [Peptostreptococcales bacterium]